MLVRGGIFLNLFLDFLMSYIYTIMQKLIIKVAMFRRGVERFEAEVNEYLNNGWSVDADSLSVEKRGFRIICKAIVWKEVAE